MGKVLEVLRLKWEFKLSIRAISLSCGIAASTVSDYVQRPAAASHRNSPAWRQRHVTRLYERIRSRKGHAVAIGAVARHLAEATYWILTKGEPYREPQCRRPSGK